VVWMSPASHDRDGDGQLDLKEFERGFAPLVDYACETILAGQVEEVVL
jgi:hypothetical protein